MGVTTLHEIEEALRACDPGTLREMTHQLAKSHVTLCGLTSREGDCSHITEQETEDRVNALEVHELATLLAPSAWTSMYLWSRL